jgi:hypothetical protein
MGKAQQGRLKLNGGSYAGHRMVRPRLVRLPPDWKPSEECHAYAAKELGRDRAWMEKELSVFRLQMRAKGEMNEDWDARFQVWMAKGHEHEHRYEPKSQRLGGGYA